MSIELYLTVDAAEMLDLSTVGKLRQVTGTIDFLAIPNAELFRSQFRTFQIAKRHPFARNEKFTFGFRWAKIVVFVDDVNLCVRKRNANQQATFVCGDSFAR